MPAYDPKRPRPSAGSSEDPAPVDTLLDPSPTTGATEQVRVAEPVLSEVPVEDTAEVPVEDPAEVPAVPVPAGEDTVEVDLRDSPLAAATSANPRVGSEVPVAAAPDEGTANRAVLIAALSATGVVAVVAAILLLRRRRTD